MKRFLADCHGNFAVIAAIVIVPLIVAVGLSVDYSAASTYRSKLQSAADAAAIAGVSLKEFSVVNATKAATDLFTAHEHGALLPVVSITSPTSLIREAAVEVSASMPTNFMKIVRIDQVDIKVYAKARRLTVHPQFCIYALDPAFSPSLKIDGSGTVSALNCGVQVNSNGAAALHQTGSGKLTAKRISVVGRSSGTGFSPVPATAQPKLPDPLIDIPEPTAPATCTFNSQMFSNVSFAANSTFCGTIDFKGVAKFAPGMYYFKGASVTVGADALLQGTGVTFYIDASSELTQSHGSGSIQLKAPTSGTYAGIALFGSRSFSRTLKQLTLIGNADYFIDGTIYLPAHSLKMSGSSDVNITSKSGYVIAYRFHFQGNSHLKIDHYTASAPAILGKTSVLLVK